MITVRAVLRKEKADITGLCPLSICITLDRKRIYHSIGIKLKPEQWDGKVKGLPNAGLINAKINRLVSDIEGKILALEMTGHVTLNAIKGLLRIDKGGSGLIQYAEDVVKVIPNNGTYRRYKVELDTLTAYGGQNLSFADITPVWLNKYYHYLTTATKDRKARQHNTAINAFKFLRMVFNHARRFGITTLYPFSSWEYPKYRATVKSYLTLEECDRIWNLATDEANGEELRLTATFFCLECFAGFRVSDWGKFSIENMIGNDELKLRTTKTGTDVRLPLDLMPRLRRTVDYITEHGLKWTYTGEHANRMLKLIGPLAKISTRLTTHVGRHTFATHMLSIGLSRETVAEMLGVSLRIVDTYAKFSPDKIRRELERIGGGL